MSRLRIWQLRARNAQLRLSNRWLRVQMFGMWLCFVAAGYRGTYGDWKKWMDSRTRQREASERLLRQLGGEE